MENDDDDPNPNISFRPWKSTEGPSHAEPQPSRTGSEQDNLDEKRARFSGPRKHGAFTIMQEIGEKVLASLAILQGHHDLLPFGFCDGARQLANSGLPLLDFAPEVGMWNMSGEPCSSWTVQPPSKPSRRGIARRAVFSDSQRQQLEDRFQHQKYISKPDRKKVAESLGLKDAQVKVWFQNRRMKWRNSKERELLASCSRYPTSQKFIENGRKLFVD